MKPYRTLRTALHALRRNIMRSVLTTLGIIIGVAAVIAMMELGNGLAADIQKIIASMGTNNLMILPGTATSGGVSFGAGSTLTLTPQDADAIAKECPAVQFVAPIVRARTQIVYNGKNWVPMFIYGTTPSYIDVRNWNQFPEGSCFTEQDVRNASKVCILGQTIVKQLFPGESPIGKEIRVQNVAFKVVGTLARKGSNGMFDQDDILLAPWTTIKYRVAGTSAGIVNQSSSSGSSSGTSSQVNSLNQLYPSSGGNLYPIPSSIQLADTPQPVRYTNVDQIMVSGQSNVDTSQAIRQITDLLHDRHRIHDGEPDDFSFRDMTEMVQNQAEAMARISNLLLAVAIISLIVGGIGIMNIMLVSVTERTREIGLRMAVGARGFDILGQFLTEAILLCLAGGAVGIIIGRSVSLAARRWYGIPTAMSVPTIVAAIIVSASVGIIFGFYPAWKASRLDPIEALRYE
jgi:ABC-type antimicrobial peptide transport system permease subunit